MSFFKKIHFLFTFLLFFFYNNVYAFNITEILNKYPDYSTFNDYLTQTKVASAINSQGTITVLAVSNANVGSLAGKTNDDLAAILSVHGILDYLDMKKLQNMKNSSMLTTVYQQTGKAKGKRGFLNVTISSNGNVFFGSSAPGSNLGAKLVDPVFAQPYTISVLQVDGVITPGTASSATNASTSPPSSSPPTPAPASSPGKTPIPVPTPGKSPSKSPSTSPPSPPAPTPATPPGAAPSNATSPPSEAPAPSTAPAPSNATTPSPSPSLSPTLAPAPGPDAAADNPPSLGTHLGHNLGAMSAVILTNVWLFAMF